MSILNLTDEIITETLKTATNILKSTGPNYLYLKVINELTGIQNSPLPIFNKPWNDGKWTENQFSVVVLH